MSDRYKGAILSPTAPTVTPQSAGGIYTSSQQLQYQGQGVWPTAFNNPINNSLRFRASASAYLNRTPASAGNRQIWTWSAWVKRGELNTADCLLGSGTNVNAGNGVTEIGFSSDQFFTWTYLSGVVWFVQSTQVFRDPSAWYHFVVAVDTTQATASNRVKMYVNGSQITALATATYPTQNYNTGFNSTDAHNIGRRPDNSNLLDGYLAEVNFIDGQQLAPSSFGTTDAYGIWQPVPYTGTYGTNGFYLKFTDNSALTTSSNVGLGRDFSGNGNYWVTNNISITAGATYDSMVDVPTNTNSNTANYCVLNPLSNPNGPIFTLSNGNLNYSCSASAGNGAKMAVISTMALHTGKVYWEILATNTNGGYGVSSELTVSSVYGVANANVYSSTQASTSGITYSGTTFTYTTNDILGFAWDGTALTLGCYKNGSLIGTFSGFSSTTVYFPQMQPASASASTTFSANFGQQPFSYTPPTGFLRLNTYNLPTPTILAGNQYMDATTYTGTGATLAVTNSGSMQPDFVWLKTRNQAGYGHELFDSVRGATKYLISNSTNAEATEATSLTAFNSNGFSVGSFGFINGSGDSIVGWQWRASNIAGVSNTQGTITSTVSANTTAGFSVVRISASGTSGSIGHGLGVAPSMIIGKNTASADDWYTYHASIGTGAFIRLNTSAAQASSASAYTNINSSTFTAGSGVLSNNAHIFYCFAAVAGYSAFGSYVGNGSTDGPFIYTGFRPRFILTKDITTGSFWWEMIDSARTPYNVVDKTLYANVSDAEYTGSSYNKDLLSNGFKIRNTNGGDNTSGSTYIYACFAENPFKIARAR